MDCGMATKAQMRGWKQAVKAAEKRRPPIGPRKEMDMRGWRGPRRKLTLEETAANAARKVERLKALMTCQCCGRKHLANRGWIAHHGYTRPYIGWQTSSCIGAKHLPFEVDRARLAIHIKDLKTFLEHAKEFLGKAEREEIPVMLSYTTYKDGRRFGYKADRIEVQFEATRATYEALKLEHPKYWEASYGRKDKFDDVKNIDIASRQSEIRFIERDIADQTKRYENWRQTHRWVAETETWEKV